MSRPDSRASRRADQGRVLASRVRRALEDLARFLRSRKAAGHVLDGMTPSLSLRLDLPLGELREDDGADRFEEHLVEEVDRRLEEAIRQAGSLCPGRVFCHSCGGPECDHARPPEPRSVFVGWTATGRPRWGEFAQLCLDRRHPQIDRLFDDPPAMLYQVQNPEELTLDLLGDLRRARGPRLLAQVALGFFPADPSDPRGSLRALTAQAILVASRRGRHRVVLNLLGAEPVMGGDDRADGQPPPWMTAARTAQGKLNTLARRVRGGAASRTRVRRGADEQGSDYLARGATAILAEFARRTARESRARGRRTRHAEERHSSGARPTRTALEDLRRAAASDLMVDERSGTYVVPGQRGRTHFFSRDGRLVSSVRYDQAELGRKRKLGLWRPASGDEAGSLREAVERHTRSGR